MQLAASAGLAPALQPIELNALAMVISSLQSQLLAKGNAAWTLTSDEHLKHASTNAKTQRFAFEKLIQILAGLRLLKPSGANEFSSFPLFRGDRWRRTEGGEFQIELDPSELGIELLLGLSDAHVDLARQARGVMRGVEALGREPPLTVWRSIWHELVGPEQILYLRMERSMQWEFRWLQLDGVFGLDLGELFQGLTLPQSDSRLAQRLKVLARLGKRLCAHGFLTKSVADQYLALDKTDAGAGVMGVWQIGRERLSSDAGEIYRSAAQAVFLKHRHPQCLDDLLRLYAGTAGAPSSLLEEGRQLFEGLRDNAAQVALAGLEAGPSQPIAPLALFIELTMRCRHARGTFAVPEGLAASRVGDYIGPKAQGTAGERFAAFNACLGDDPDLARAIRELPMASFASAVSQADPEFSAFLAQGAKPRLVAPIGEASASALASQEAKMAQARKKAAVSGAMASRMLKVASEELQRLRSGYPDRYKTLRKNYLESLDPGGRKLMLDVQRRMQPSMFEEHLRQRLVRFMVDHPGAWGSATSAQFAEV